MSSRSQAGSPFPSIVGAIGCFALAFESLSRTRFGASVPEYLDWMIFAIFALIAIGIGSAARTTQSTAAWIGLAAFLGSTVLATLNIAAFALLDHEALPNPELMAFASQALRLLMSASLLIWSVGTLWSGSTIVARILSLALLTGLAMQVGSWFAPLGTYLPIDVIEILEFAFPIQWAALGLILLRLRRHAASKPRSYAGLPPDLPGALVGVWGIFLIVAYVVASRSAAKLRGGGEALVEIGVVTAGAVIAIQCLLVAVVLWFVRVMGPGQISSSSESEGHNPKDPRE